MKNKVILSEKLSRISRRRFLGATTAITTGALFPSVLSCESSGKLTNRLDVLSSQTPNSLFAGVQIGVITYSFRDLEGGVETTLNACIDAGLNSIELMGTGVEEYLGAPRNPVKHLSNHNNPRSHEEKQAVELYYDELWEWRKMDETINNYTQLRKKFNDAGIKIHIYKWTAGDTEEEIDYSFKVAKELGAVGISAELNDKNARLLGPVAESNGMFSILHNHAQFAEPGFDVDKLLDYSPANRLNFDVGHYFGSTGLNPTDFIRDYHDRIVSIHLKDKTSSDNVTLKDANQVWGQGETPLAEILHFIRDREFPIYCDIELEYPVNPWSTSIKEVKICKEFCRQILI